MEWNWKQILVIIVIVISGIGFLPYAFTNNSNGGATPNELPPSGVSGLARTTVTIEEYEPYLTIPSNVSPERLEAIRSLAGVEDVRLRQNTYLVTVIKRDDLEPVYVALQEQGLEPIATAFIAFPSLVEIETSQGMETVATDGIRIRQPIAYVVPAGTVANATIGLAAEQGRAVSLTSFELVLEREEVVVRVRTGMLTGQTTEYAIPWEERTAINASALRTRFSNATIQYVERNYVEFNRTITTAEQQEMTGWEYVTQIAGDRIFVLSNFTDSERVLQDMGAVQFPDSTLRISGVHTFERMGKRSYWYDAELIELPVGYIWLANATVWQSESEMDTGSEVEGTVTVERLGDVVVKITGGSS